MKCWRGHRGRTGPQPVYPHYLNFNDVCRVFYGDDMPVEPDPDDWREAAEQDAADDE